MKVDLLALFELINKRLEGIVDVEMRLIAARPSEVAFYYWRKDGMVFCRALSLVGLERSVAGIEGTAKEEAGYVLKLLKFQPPFSRK